MLVIGYRGLANPIRTSTTSRPTVKTTANTSPPDRHRVQPQARSLPTRPPSREPRPAGGASEPTQCHPAARPDDGRARVAARAPEHVAMPSISVAAGGQLA